MSATIANGRRPGQSTLANLRRILESDLIPSLKILAVALALHGDADGQGIYPSVRTLATWTGRSRRAVQIGLRDLERLDIIHSRTKGGYASSDRNPRGGYTTVYGFHFDHLPAKGRSQLRPSSTARAQRKGEASNTKGRSPLRIEGDAHFARSTLDLLRSTQREEQAQPRAERRSPTKLNRISQSFAKAYREVRKP